MAQSAVEKWLIWCYSICPSLATERSGEFAGSTGSELQPVMTTLVGSLSRAALPNTRNSGTCREPAFDHCDGDCKIIAASIGFVRPLQAAERSRELGDGLLTLLRCADTMNLLLRARAPACRVPVV